jgi:uncharacterized protein DUF6789
VKHSSQDRIVLVESQIAKEEKVNRPNVKRALAGGFIATLAMTMMMYLVAPMMGVKMDIAGSLAGMLGVPWTAGLIVHFLNGVVIFPLIYALVLFRALKGGPAVRGISWSLVLWLMAQLVVMPMIGAGVFSSQIGGMTAAMASLLGHLVYGALLGAIAGRAALPITQTPAGQSLTLAKG